MKKDYYIPLKKSMQLPLDWWKPLVLIVCLWVTACGDGLSTVTSSDAAACRVVHMYGDSITHQAGQTIEQFLPCYTVVNHGADGTMARDMPIPDWDKDAVYTISYGVNECLGGVSSVDYYLRLNHILNAGRGQRIVLEAPWRVVDPRCSDSIDQYRGVVIALGAVYKVQVAVLDMNQDHIGEGIHLTQAHMQARSRVLAAEILKFN